MDAAELRMYEAIRSGGRRQAVAELTEDGAHDFSPDMSSAARWMALRMRT